MARDDMDDVHDYIPRSKGEVARGGRRRGRKSVEAPEAPRWVCPHCGRPIERVHSWMWAAGTRAHITCPGSET